VSRSPFLFGSNTPRQLVIAHRGARSLAPENTLAAAEAAQSLGADLWEFDVATTRDGELILLHDETLSRTTDVALRYPDRSPWRAADFTWDEIQTLDAGSWFLRNDPFGTLAQGMIPLACREHLAGQRVLTLREALAWSAGGTLGADIELKRNDGSRDKSDQTRRTVERTVSLVREFGLEKSVFISSFEREMIRHLKAIAPEIAGVLLFHTLPSNASALLGEIGADGVAIRLPAFEKEAARTLTQGGYGVYVWTVNGPQDLAYLAQDSFLSGIITDWPQRLLEILGRAPDVAAPAPGGRSG
jgi:glycerophosphoryl diester phosphodiesterase